MFVVKSDRKFACFVKKSADHFVDYFIGLNVFPICLARSVLLFLENTLTVETTAIRENRIAPGIISESHFLVSSRNYFREPFFGGDGMLSEFALPLDFTLLSACIFLNYRPE